MEKEQYNKDYYLQIINNKLTGSIKISDKDNSLFHTSQYFNLKFSNNIFLRLFVFVVKKVCERQITREVEREYRKSILIKNNFREFRKMNVG